MSMNAVLYCLFVLVAIISCNRLSFQSFESSSSAASILCNIERSSVAIQKPILDSWILINAKFLYKLNSTTIQNQVLIKNIPLSENRYSIAMYERHQDKIFNLIVVNDIDVIPYSTKFQKESSNISNLPIIDYAKPFRELSSPAFSTYYTTINYFVAMSWQNITYNMKQLNMDTSNVPNFETVILSDDNVTIYDLNAKWEYTLNASKYNSSIKPVKQNVGYPQFTPSKYGYYCVYTNPPNKYLAPDCPNAINVLKEHAKMLSSSGIDFIIPDDTNDVHGPSNTNSYIKQIRPNELIFQTFAELKNNGSNAPFVAIWNKADGVQWQTNLEFYNNYTDLIYTGGKAKKAYFIVNDANNVPNQTIIKEIESNGGKNDIECIYMWAERSAQQMNAGIWTDWQPCSPMTNSLESITECNIGMTKNSYLGSEISASFRSGAPYGSMPLSQATKLNGRTFQLIIKDCLSLKPDNVHYPSFNEHHCGAHTITGNNVSWSNGLYKDVGRAIFFYENYGTEASRAFEPSKEAGDYYWLLMQSCSRVLRLQYYFGGLLSADNVSICNVVNEICCNALTSYNDIWSLIAKDGSDYLLSNDKNEVNTLINIDKKYSEICAVKPYSNTSVFCEKYYNEMTVEQVHQGPFILYADSKTTIGSLAVTNIPRVSIYRCIDTNNGKHFIANNGANCDGVTGNYKMDILLGYAAQTPSTAMARRIMRCVNTKGVYYTTIGDECYEKNSKSALLGFAL